jgi:hypothetical protein
MIIYDLDIEGIAVIPNETDSPLIVYANTPLSLPVTGKFLQHISRRSAQVVEPTGHVQHLQFTFGNSPKCLEPLGRFSVIEGFGVFALERLDHGLMV